MDYRKLVKKMTLEEKASLCSGKDFWHTKGVERLNIPEMMMSDGPHGLRKQDELGDHLGVNDSIKAVCFPAGCAVASSFDRELIRKVGETLGNECQAEGVGVILGPAVNLKRSPLCGRNFEYFSEDPYLASEMAASQIQGIQSQNVGTSIKHFYANNQEHRRMSSSSEVDERTARELYLAAFEGAVKKAKPWTVMCSYNRINGVYAAQNKKALTHILRDEWGFDGYVVSDWGAANDRVPDLEAGMDLEMPSSFGLNDEKIIKAVKEGNLSEKVLDKAVERILNIVYRFEENRKPSAVFDREKDHELARKVAAECMVLLKNEDVLPLKQTQKVAFIGEFAKKPRYQGGGSSHINSFKVETAWDNANHDYVVFAKGYETKKDEVRKDFIVEAAKVAREVEVAVVFAGLPDSFESEGYDRTHMRLPDNQNALIEAVCDANPNTVVVLHNGSPVEMPWVHRVKAVLEVYLGGQAVGGATVDVLYGKVSPSGRLAESFPIKLEDNPSYLYYGGEGDKTEYREGVFIGYRYYDKKKMEVLFPFGHGLSYTTFSYSNLKLDKEKMSENETLTVSVDVTNTGVRKGKEVVQLYIEPQKSEIIRPVRELKGFEKIELDVGETKTVFFELSRRDFSYYNIEKGWTVETTSYLIEIAKSSRDICLSEAVMVRGTCNQPEKITMDTTLGDVLLVEGAKELLAPWLEVFDVMGNSEDEDVLGDGSKQMEEAMTKYMPIHGLVSFANGEKTFEEAEELVRKLNQLL